MRYHIDGIQGHYWGALEKVGWLGFTPPFPELVRENDD